ncbi:MAG: hypothetical protein ACREQY_08895, partial [Candidatus Binatia bacterium]
WQDHREGNNDIYLSFSDDEGATWAPNLRVDDTGDGPSNQYAPSLTVNEAKVLVVWQDDRSGVDQVFAAWGAPAPQ